MIGSKLTVFIDELFRQVCGMSEDEKQRTAGSIVKTLLKRKLIDKDQVSLRFMLSYSPYTQTWIALNDKEPVITFIFTADSNTQRWYRR